MQIEIVGGILCFAVASLTAGSMASDCFLRNSDASVSCDRFSTCSAHHTPLSALRGIGLNRSPHLSPQNGATHGKGWIPSHGDRRAWQDDARLK